MKDKILKAIDKGLLNVLSTDIEDVDIDFNHNDVDNTFISYNVRTVDMGLQSGLLWCEYNLGAFPGFKADDWYGDYYAWGETEPKNEFTWENYKYCEGETKKVSKYNTKKNNGIIDNIRQLEYKDDAVTTTLNNEFRMPTRGDYQELCDNTVNKWVKNYNGVKELNGMLFTAENGNVLFFPAAGTYEKTSGEHCYLWTSSLDSNVPYSAYTFCFYEDDIQTDKSIARYFGFVTRGVKDSHLKDKE